MPGRLDRRSLEALVRKGEIDTVLTVFPDGYARLMGKRLTARHFLEHALEDGVHACIYLFTVDMEMEPLPGFTLTSWERGYGDMKMVPDLATLRLIPWLPKTALVFCDVYTEEGEPIEEAPRWVLKRQIERARPRATSSRPQPSSSSTCFRETFEEARAKRYQNLTPFSTYLEDYHILQTSKEEPLVRAIRNGMEAADVPVEFSKGEWGRGQEEINLVYAEALEMADRHVLYKHGAKEIAHLQGCSRDVHGEIRHGRGRLVLPPALLAVGPRRTQAALRRRQELPPGAAGLPPLAGRTDGHGARAGVLLRARPSTPTSATRPARSRRRASPAAGTTAPAASASAARARRFRVENRIPGADANPYLAFAATIAAGLHGVENKLKAAQALRGQRLRGRPAAPGAQDAARGHRRARALQGRARGVRRPAWSSTICTTAVSSSKPSTNRSPTGS